MKRGYVLPRYLPHVLSPERRQQVRSENLPVCLERPRLPLGLHMFTKEPYCKALEPYSPRSPSFSLCGLSSLSLGGTFGLLLGIAIYAGCGVAY